MGRKQKYEKIKKMAAKNQTKSTRQRSMNASDFYVNLSRQKYKIIPKKKQIPNSPKNRVLPKNPSSNQKKEKKKKRKKRERVRKSIDIDRRSSSISNPLPPKRKNSHFAQKYEQITTNNQKNHYLNTQYYPTSPFGTIDTAKQLKLSQSDNAKYDAPIIHHRNDKNVHHTKAKSLLPTTLQKKKSGPPPSKQLPKNSKTPSPGLYKTNSASLSYANAINLKKNKKKLKKNHQSMHNINKKIIKIKPVPPIYKNEHSKKLPSRPLPPR